MKLTELFTGDKQITDRGNTQSSMPQNNSIVNRQIRAMVPGQTIQGELIARNGNEVQIRVSDDMVLKAKLDQSMNLEVGKTMIFEVKNNGQALVLSPLYENTATDANVLKALDMASLPVNQDTIAMTELMMRVGLSIDRTSLQQVFRESNVFAGADISNIVDLHKLGMPVNESNLAQVESYKNLSHQLVNSLNNCLEALPDTIQGMLQSGDMQGAARLYQELFHMIQELPGEELAVNLDVNSSLAGNAAGEVLLGERVAAANAEVQGNAVALNAVVNQSTASAAMPTAEDALLQLLSEKAFAQQEVMQNAMQTIKGEVDNAFLQKMSGNTQAALAKEIVSLLEQKPQPELFQKVVQHGLMYKASGLLQAVLGSKELQGFLQEKLQTLWTIRPDQVADAEQVEELYSRLNRQLRGLSQALENVNQNGSEVYRAVNNLTQNLDFLQQLNQTYAYVQLPLRLQQGNQAHGELFVYTNKKNLAARDGQISALLHLDMENLGPVDVYVAMQNERVSTKFYVQDDDMLDFLMDHIDILTERLKQRGYDCSCEMKVRETEEKTNGQNSAVQQLLRKGSQVPIVQYAFDVRT